MIIWNIVMYFMLGENMSKYWYYSNAVNDSIADIIADYMSKLW